MFGMYGNPNKLNSSIGHYVKLILNYCRFLDCMENIIDFFFCVRWLYRKIGHKLCSGIFLPCQLFECQLKLYIQYISFRVWYGFKDNLLERIFWLKQGQK